MSEIPDTKSGRRALTVTFPGGLAVESDYRGFKVLTDQPERSGGRGSGPAPFDLFLASIGTCAGFYALQFLRGRDLPIEGLSLTLEPLRAEGSKRIETLRIRVELPDCFPQKYRRPLERAIDQCAVKRHIVDPPAFEVVLGDDSVSAA
jgi:ribosomal protein S12 methylthiotransferase accessory factor